MSGINFGAFRNSKLRRALYHFGLWQPKLNHVGKDGRILFIRRFSGHTQKDLFDWLQKDTRLA